MSTGGIFQLITNDGKQDRMLMATSLLNQRLQEITTARQRNGYRDTSPTLVDIERTHILFMNAHFKPFAAIGYEYMSSSVQAGSARLGGQVQFSIPQFGDFFHDMVLRVKLGAVEAVNSAYWSDPASNPAQGNELLRYVDYLGQKLVKRVAFTVNNNPLDEYNSDIMNFHREFYITPNKIVGWKRNVAQELPKKAYSDVSGRGTGLREEKSILDGPQTAKASHKELDVWLPLLFWFNKDPRLSVPSVCIPYGQRFIDVQFSAANEILQHQHASNPALDSPATNPVPVPDILKCDLYINNVFVNPEIHDIFIKRIGFSLIRVHRFQTARVSKSEDQIHMNQMKWPIETLYVGLRPSENSDTASTGMLENWYKYSQVVDRVVSTGGLSDYAPLLAAPATALAVTVADVDAVLPAFSASGVALQSLSSLTGLAGATAVTRKSLNTWLGFYGFKQLSGAAAGTFLGGNILAAEWSMPPALITDQAGVPAGVEAGSGAQPSQVRYKTCIPTISSLEITAHSIAIYKELPSQFFNAYTAFNFGGLNINTPEDCGALMIPFNLYPGAYQPSGHLNISRAREFYLTFKSDVVGKTVSQADLIIIGVAINFLLISDGSAVLRYAT